MIKASAQRSIKRRMMLSKKATMGQPTTPIDSAFAAAGDHARRVVSVENAKRSLSMLASAPGRFYRWAQPHIADAFHKSDIPGFGAAQAGRQAMGRTVQQNRALMQSPGYAGAKYL
jgi:hypothetical protein